MSGRLSIYTLGNFKIENGQQSITGNIKKSSKRWKLFQYLLTFSHREISREELIMVLKLHNNDDPEGALSALVYRLRKILSDYTNKAKHHFIETTGSAYTFNQNAHYWHDAEEFENLCQQIDQFIQNNSDEVIDIYDQAIDIYNGDYLNEAKSEEWLWSKRNHYRDLLKNTFFKIEDYLKENKDYKNLIRLYDETMQLIQFDEEIIAGSLKSLIKMGKYSQAQYRYNEIKEMYDDNGLIFPPELESLDLSNGNNAEDPVRFLEKLDEECEHEGAFVCSPDKFVELYELEKRRMTREVPPRCVIHIRLAVKDVNKDEDMYFDNLDEIGEEFFKLFTDHLRSGDIVCRWSKKHFIALLANLEYEDAEKITRRIKNLFQAKYGLPDNVDIQKRIYDLC